MITLPSKQNISQVYPVHNPLLIHTSDTVTTPIAPPGLGNLELTSTVRRIYHFVPDIQNLCYNITCAWTIVVRIITNMTVHLLVLEHVTTTDFK